MKRTEGCRSQASAELNLTPPAGALAVAAWVTLQPMQEAAAMTSFADWIVVCPACV